MKEYIWPSTVPPKSARAVIVPSGKAEKNRYTGSVTIFDNGTAFWRQKIIVPFIKQDGAFDLDNLLVQLDGHKNGVWLKDWDYQSRGNWEGLPVVDGANQEGKALNIRGASANTLIALVGDRFQLGTRMHQLTQPALTNAQGKVTLYFEPKLLSIPADGMALITDEPKCLYRWMNISNRPLLERNRKIIRGADLLFEEAR